MQVVALVYVLLAAAVAVRGSPLAMQEAGAVVDGAAAVKPPAGPLPPPLPPAAVNRVKPIADRQPQPAAKNRPIVAASNCVVEFDNAIYSFGVSPSSQPPYTAQTHDALAASLWRYDEMLKQWRMILFGGVDASKPKSASDSSDSSDSSHSELLDDLWSYGLIDKSWKLLSGSANKPVPEVRFAQTGAGVGMRTIAGRVNAVTVIDNTRTNMWLFGGRTASGDVLNDLYRYNLADGLWYAADYPSAEYAAAIGFNQPTYYPPAAALATGGIKYGIPGARERSACVVDSTNHLVCYGGLGYATDAQYFGTLSDVWSYPLTVPASGVPPAAAWTHMVGSNHFAINENVRYEWPNFHHIERVPMQVDSPQYYAFKQQLQDEEQATEEEVEQTEAHTVAVQAAEEEAEAEAESSLLAVRAGAGVRSSSRSAARSRVRAIANARSRLRASVSASASMKDLPPSPGGRYGHVMTYDRDANRLWMFGGADAVNDAMNDLWALRLSDAAWIPYRRSTPIAPAAALNVATPLSWPAPIYNGWNGAVLSPARKQLYVIGGADARSVWNIDLYGRVYTGVNVCSSSPCVNAVRCEVVADSELLGAGAAYKCICNAGFTGSRCQIGTHLFPAINNPFMGDHSLPHSDLGHWKPIEDVTKPYPIIEAFVPPAVAPPAPPVPVTVGPARIPSTETRRVQVIRDPNTPKPELPVELTDNLASHPQIIADAYKTLKTSTRTIETHRDKIRRISNAPLSAPLQPPPAPAPAPAPAAAAH